MEDSKENKEENQNTNLNKNEEEELENSEEINDSTIEAKEKKEHKDLNENKKQESGGSEEIKKKKSPGVVNPEAEGTLAPRMKVGSSTSSDIAVNNSKTKVELKNPKVARSSNRMPVKTNLKVSEKKTPGGVEKKRKNVQVQSSSCKRTVQQKNTSSVVRRRNESIESSTKEKIVVEAKIKKETGLNRSDNSKKEVKKETREIKKVAFVTKRKTRKANSERNLVTGDTKAVTEEESRENLETEVTEEESRENLETEETEEEISETVVTEETEEDYGEEDYGF